MESNMKTYVGTIFLILFLFPSFSFSIVISFSGISSTMISEDTIDETKLTTISLTGVTTGKTATCDLNPTQSNFFVKLDPGTVQYSVYLKAMPILNFNTNPSYSLTVQCTDGVSTDQKTYTVNIDNNKSPSITNLHNYTTLSAVTTPTGTLVFTVTATDPENDTLSFALTCYVLSVLTTSCPFTIYDSGQLVATSDLITTTVTSYDLRVTVQDTHGHTIGPQSLIVTVTGINTPPTINSNSLPYTEVVLENSAKGLSVYQVEITDPDVGDIHTYASTFTPATASNYFTVDSSNGIVRTSTVSNIDYDTLAFKSCKVDITVSDSYASDSGVLTINIANVNEAPKFAKSLYTLSGTEAPAGTSFGTPLYGVTDPEGDKTTYGIDCTTFNINSVTGEVTLSVNYDRDDPTVAYSVTCIVTVSDGTLSSTATLQVYFDYANDNTPQFSQNSYSFHVSPYAQVGTIIDVVTATDADAGDDGIVSYSILSGPYSDIFGVDTSGNIYVKEAINDTYGGTTLSVTARAYDRGNKKDEVTVSFVIEATTTTVTTTTTDRYMTFFDSPANVSWFSALMIILLGLAVFLIWEAFRNDLIYKICSSCNNCRLPKWKRSIKLEENLYDDEIEDRTPTPPTPVTPVESGKADLGWDAWNNSTKGQPFF